MDEPARMRAATYEGSYSRCSGAKKNLGIKGASEGRKGAMTWTEVSSSWAGRPDALGYRTDGSCLRIQHSGSFEETIIGKMVVRWNRAFAPRDLDGSCEMMVGNTHRHAGIPSCHYACCTAREVPGFSIPHKCPCSVRSLGRAP